MIRSFSSVRAGFAAIRDRSAALLGARLHDSWQRRTRFLASGLVLFVAAELLPSACALSVLAITLWLLLSVSLAWGVNEKQRGRIAKKIDNTPPDSLPDLRDLALLTALALLGFLPLLLKKTQDSFGLFRLVEQPGPFAWLWFLLDKTYLRALPDAIDLGFTRLERLHAAGIDYHPGQPGYAGRGLVMFAYTLVYLILVQGLLRLWRLHEELSTKTYRPGAYRRFFIYEPKKRQISAAPYRDRLVHHALVNVLEPIYERTFLADSYACRKGTSSSPTSLSNHFKQWVHEHYHCEPHEPITQNAA